ncbi:MAG: diguanylate cyclase [Mycobacteriales bacterium]
MEGPARVLVVEDDPSVVMLTVMVLEEQGFVVSSARGCDEAAAQVLRDVPDVILLDLQLPDGSGAGLLAGLQLDPVTSSIPVVVMTGSTEQSRVVELLGAGAHDYLTKPVDVAELVARTRAALRVKRAHDELARLARTDALTGLPNRRALDDALVSWQAHASRTCEPLSVAMLDVIDFKGVNDIHGHHVGDRVLRQIAEVLQTGRRAGDVLGRWGGDEFVAVLPGSDLPHARGVVERLQRAVRERIELPGRLVELRSGIAEHRPGLVVGDLLRAVSTDLHDGRMA